MKKILVIFLFLMFSLNTAYAQVRTADPQPPRSDPEVDGATFLSDGGSFLGITTMLTEIDTTYFAPWSGICKLAIEYGPSVKGVATGFIFGWRTVITAGHVLYDTDYGHATKIIVMPGWDGEWPEIFNMPGPGSNGYVGPFGYAYGVSWKPHPEWVRGHFGYDAGVIKVDRAIGSITGTIGIIANNSCDTIENSRHTSGSFPRSLGGCNAHINGRNMFAVKVMIDYCNIYAADYYTGPSCYETSYHGSSGGPYIFNYEGKDYAGSIHHGIEGNQALTTRIHDELYTFIYDYRDAVKNQSFDAQVLWLSPKEYSVYNDDPKLYRRITVEQGESFRAKALHHNTTRGSKTDYWRTSYYLSRDNRLDSSDKLLGNYGDDRTFGPEDHLWLWADIEMPIDVEPGNYYLIVKLDISDSNISNNVTDGMDACPITVKRTSKVTLPPDGPQTGDVYPANSGDGVIDPSDARFIARLAVKKETLTSFAADRADFRIGAPGNCEEKDGRVNLRDVLEIVNTILGKPTCEHGGN